MLKWKAGKSLLDNEDIASMQPRKLWSKMAYVPQAKSVSSAYTALEMVLLGRSSHLNVFESPGQEDVKPGDIRATLLSRKNHNEELYLCNPRVPNSNLFLYVKFAINPDSSIDIISFHESSEPIYVSFEKASDFQDNSFEERALKKTIYNYRRFSKINRNEVVDFFMQGNVAKITFKDDVDEATKTGIIKSLPADMCFALL